MMVEEDVPICQDGVSFYSEILRSTLFLPPMHTLTILPLLIVREV